MPEICHVCSKGLSSFRSLSKHIRDQHKELSLENYSNKYLGTTSTCSECGKQQKWIGFSIGYKCSHACGAKKFRRELKTDPLRFKQFSQKLSSLQSRVWANREATGEKQEIFSRIGSTIKDNNSKLTPEQRCMRFGWTNALGMGFTNSGLVKDQYYRLVRSITEQTYKDNEKIINPYGLPRGKGKSKYHLDHKYSIAYGFLNNIPAEIIGSIVNLQLISCSQNSKKSLKCDISLEDLLAQYGELHG